MRRILASPLLTSREMPSREYIASVLNATRERVNTLKDVYKAGSYFFDDPVYSSDKILSFRERHSSDLIGKSPK
jgi:Anticodon binding domain